MTLYVRKNGSREATPIAAGEGTSMQVLISPDEAPNFALRKFTMDPFGGMPRHTNIVEHEQYIIKGSAIVEIGTETFEVCAGDSVYIPSLVPHSYKAGHEGFEFICVVPNKADKIEIL